VLTVAFFGSGGEGSMVPLDAVSKVHQVIAVVRPASARSGLGRALRSLFSRLGIGQRAVLSRWARRNDVPLFDAVSGRDPELVDRLKRLAPDVICVSAFPWLLGGEILGLARRSALNLHSSLLPRHRGPNPLLWIYYENDKQTGVTVHQMNLRADAGDILAQESFDLPRGFAVDRLYSKKAELGGRLLVQVLGKLETSDLNPILQDERFSSYAPQISHGVGLVNFSEWDVERVWHFLSGLCARRREPLWDARGKRVHYRSVLGYTPSDCCDDPGALRSASFGWNLYCRGGSVQLGDARRQE
jgi:methionyl-tRNA formyltransferase